MTNRNYDPPPFVMLILAATPIASWKVVELIWWIASYR